VEPGAALTPGPEGRLLAGLGAWLFASPRPTPAVLALLGLGALAVILLRHLVLARVAFGRPLLAVLRRGEMGFLALLLLSMVVLSALQIVARNAFGAGILWIDPLLRYSTLWIGFLGAALAAGEGRHIQMDVLGRALPPGPRRLAGRLTHLAAAATSAVLAESAYRHLASEYSYGAREFLRLPTWILLVVIPAALAVMVYRFLDRALVPPLEAAPPAPAVGTEAASS
jgi:TRAP-type C4-dicarboxylate transport system permease small subunit